MVNPSSVDPMLPESKNALVRRLVYEGEYKKALQICKEWNYENPEHSEILRLGYDCLMYPEFYKQLGKSPAYHYQEAVRVLKEVYAF